MRYILRVVALLEACDVTNEKSLKDMHFHSKRLDHLLLMTSYLVTIATDNHYTCLRMRDRDKWTATENVRCWCFIVYGRKKLKKNSGGGKIYPNLSKEAFYLAWPRPWGDNSVKSCFTQLRSKPIRRHMFNSLTNCILSLGGSPIRFSGSGISLIWSSGFGILKQKRELEWPK